MYDVQLTLRAQSDLRQAQDYIKTDSPRNAHQWLQRIEQRIQTLNQFPDRHGVAPEGHFLCEPIRQMIEGNYRILYIVRGSSVLVLTIRHAARQFAEPNEFAPDSEGLETDDLDR